MLPHEPGHPYLDEPVRGEVEEEHPRPEHPRDKPPEVARPGEVLTVPWVRETEQEVDDEHRHRAAAEEWVAQGLAVQEQIHHVHPKEAVQRPRGPRRHLARVLHQSREKVPCEAGGAPKGGEAQPAVLALQQQEQQVVEEEVAHQVREGVMDQHRREPSRALPRLDEFVAGPRAPVDHVLGPELRPEGVPKGCLEVDYVPHHLGALGGEKGVQAGVARDVDGLA
mmetsp:Transcript_12039/g.38123  ORF Transcript_12039/g.38123 Transcript_12039/m.38123 type:complete len:224 (-) Transcript_12039:1795-2466(-)